MFFWGTYSQCGDVPKSSSVYSSFTLIRAFLGFVNVVNSRSGGEKP